MKRLVLAAAVAVIAACSGSSAPPLPVCVGSDVLCGGACADLSTNRLNCGACGTACATGQACTAGQCTATCSPVALDLSAPLETAAPPFASASSLQAPTALWASPAPPLPTNASWENLVLGAGGNRVDFLPYQISVDQAWLYVGAAAPTTPSTATQVTVPDLRQLLVGASELGGTTTRAVTAWDLFSVTLRFTQGGGTMTAPLVEGMPYVTADYANLQPVILPGSDGVASRTITSVTSSSGAVVTGSGTPVDLAADTRFLLALSDGTTWIAYTSSPVVFNYVPGKLYVTSKFTGTLRVAKAPTPADVAVLDAHAGVIPRGGTMDVSISCDVATLTFSFITTPASGSVPLLMAALPHHRARLRTPASTTGPTYQTIRGALIGVEGSTWTMSLPLSTIGWTAPRPMVPAHLEAVRAALLGGDVNYVPDAVKVDTDSYFGGKYLAKLARLALIADELGETAAAATLRGRLKPLVEAWLNGSNGNPLVYDATWGGVAPHDALLNPNPAVDFGVGNYNDHHFHYGYHLYAAAALARTDPAFATTHRQALLALVRDIANPSAADPRFPRFRHMDFFRGHSWASGLYENGFGRDQESSSEAVNAWYAIHLLGLAMGDSRISDLGRLLQALEVDAAQAYWQIPLASTVYQDPFAQNRCVGRLYQTRATFDTFFGTEPYKVYGIQMLPYTPASEALLSPAWVTDALPQIRSTTATAPQEWTGFFSMAHATFAREAAWSEVTPLTAWDDGNSKTNTLWWVASRP